MSLLLDITSKSSCVVWLFDDFDSDFSYVSFVFYSLKVLMSSAYLSPNNFVAEGLFEHNDRYSGSKSRFNFSIRNSLHCAIACARILKVSPARSLTLVGTLSDFMVFIVFRTDTIAWHREN